MGLRLVTALSWYWLHHGQQREGRRWLEALLAAPGAAGVSDSVRAAYQQYLALDPTPVERSLVDGLVAELSAQCGRRTKAQPVERVVCCRDLPVLHDTTSC